MAVPTASAPRGGRYPQMPPAPEHPVLKAARLPSGRSNRGSMSCQGGARPSSADNPQEADAFSRLRVRPRPPPADPHMASKRPSGATPAGDNWGQLKGVRAPRESPRRCSLTLISSTTMFSMIPAYGRFFPLWWLRLPAGLNPLICLGHRRERGMLWRPLLLLRLRGL